MVQYEIAVLGPLACPIFLSCLSPAQWEEREGERVASVHTHPQSLEKEKAKAGAPRQLAVHNRTMKSDTSKSVKMFVGPSLFSASNFEHQKSNRTFQMHF